MLNRALRDLVTLEGRIVQSLHQPRKFAAAGLLFYEITDLFGRQGEDSLCCIAYHMRISRVRPSSQRIAAKRISRYGRGAYQNQQVPIRVRELTSRYDSGESEMTVLRQYAQPSAYPNSTKRHSKQAAIQPERLPDQALRHYDGPLNFRRRATWFGF